jgi:uncharacterized SAM-binding protein YcdF (DUF218 family)
MRLTSNMRRTLRLARDQGISTSRPGVHGRTIRTLRDRGLLERRRNRKGMEVWRPTELGLRALVSVAPRMFLHERSQYGYTSRLDKRLVGEPEALRGDDDERERRLWHGWAA